MKSKLILWPAGQPIRVLLTSERLAGSDNLEADLDVRVSQSDGDTSANSDVIHIRVKALVVEFGARE
jgi:hypothetical protein